MVPQQRRVAWQVQMQQDIAHLQKGHSLLNMCQRGKMPYKAHFTSSTARTLCTVYLLSEPSCMVQQQHSGLAGAKMHGVSCALGLPNNR